MKRFSERREMMATVKALFGRLKELPSHRWSVSVNGKRKGKVIEHRVGSTGQTGAWTEFKFSIEQQEMSIRGEKDASGEERIFFNQQPVQNADIEFYPTTRGFFVMMVVKFKFTDEHNASVEYRFDGRMWP